MYCLVKEQCEAAPGEGLPAQDEDISEQVWMPDVSYLHRFKDNKQL